LAGRLEKKSSSVSKLSLLAESQEESQKNSPKNMQDKIQFNPKEEVKSQDVDNVDVEGSSFEVNL
jgi:hypothetical protein